MQMRCVVGLVLIHVLPTCVLGIMLLMRCVAYYYRVIHSYLVSVYWKVKPAYLVDIKFHGQGSRKRLTSDSSCEQPHKTVCHRSPLSPTISSSHLSTLSYEPSGLSSSSTLSYQSPSLSTSLSSPSTSLSSQSTSLSIQSASLSSHGQSTSLSSQSTSLSSQSTSLSSQSTSLSS